MILPSATTVPDLPCRRERTRLLTLHLLLRLKPSYLLGREHGVRRGSWTHSAVGLSDFATSPRYAGVFHTRLFSYLVSTVSFRSFVSFFLSFSHYTWSAFLLFLCLSNMVAQGALTDCQKVGQPSTKTTKTATTMFPGFSRGSAHPDLSLSYYPLPCGNLSLLFSITELKSSTLRYRTGQP